MLILLRAGLVFAIICHLLFLLIGSPWSGWMRFFSLPGFLAWWWMIWPGPGVAAFFFSLGTVMNTVAIMGNGWKMPVLQRSASELSSISAIHVPLDFDIHRYWWLTDILVGSSSLGDWFLVGGFLLACLRAA